MTTMREVIRLCEGRQAADEASRAWAANVMVRAALEKVLRKADGWAYSEDNVRAADRKGSGAADSDTDTSTLHIDRNRGQDQVVIHAVSDARELQVLAQIFLGRKLFKELFEFKAPREAKQVAAWVEKTLRAQGIVEATADDAVGRTILAQLGGERRLNAMIGIKAAVVSDQALKVRFRARGRDGIQMFTVTLTPDDTYDVAFQTASGRTVDTADGVYADGLRRAIEGRTGLALSL